MRCYYLENVICNRAMSATWDDCIVRSNYEASWMSADRDRMQAVSREGQCAIKRYDSAGESNAAWRDRMVLIK